MKKNFLPLFLLCIGCLTLTGCSTKRVALGDTVCIHYSSHFSDGKLFEVNVPTKEMGKGGITGDDTQVCFTVGTGDLGAIPGFIQGIIGMNVGEKKTFTVTPDQGYGAMQDPLNIQKISQLIFDKAGVKAKEGTEITLGDIHGFVKGKETDMSGNLLVLLDLNPRQTWDTMTFEVNMLSITK